MEIVRTDSENEDFIKLVKSLDEYLALKDGEEHSFYVQFNKTDDLKNCILLIEDSEAVGCGAIKHFDDISMEVKRMFVKPEFRNKGYASKILESLEKWAFELGYQQTVLETGKRQEEAVSLYKKTYEIIPNYAQYAHAENSICFRKKL